MVGRISPIKLYFLDIDIGDATDMYSKRDI